jgi:threonyl-tRNA synthetase
MKMDDEELVLRPMNCPHHMLVYKNSMHSYKDLPIRIGELAHDYRYEASGAVCGLERVRCMCMNDAHIFVTPEQIENEFSNVVELILSVYKDFNITDYSFRLSLRDPEDKEKYFPDDDMWNMAEDKLRKVLNDLKIEYHEDIGEAAFYGPKLDVQVKSAIGHEFTLSTCQLDFLLPKRFELTYIDSDGAKKTPVVIHRAITSTSERFVSYLIERYKGAFTLWLSPLQVNVIPVNNEYHLEYANCIKKELESHNIRVSVDDREEKLGYKMRESVIKKTPYTLILGDKEKNTNTISYRLRGTESTENITLEDFINRLEQEIKDKTIF